ncbi:MAG: NAD(P)-dependent oxidoreductase [Bacteroidia bacterium]|nr:NAD(P)-dependent oxidoreductase [Bacteroidia bacterium]
MAKKNIAIIGGGASALMLACSLDASKYNISIYEKNAAVGRKFLVAGKGGFNLTHSEDVTQFAERYHPKKFIEPFIEHFSNTDFRNWLTSIGIETYVGSSKRVFPKKGIKPIEVLKAIESQLQKNKASVFYNHTWQGWDNDELLFSHQNELIKIKPDVVVFALGGASWKVTGSDGSWTSYFNEKGIQIKKFYPSNCAYKINWNSAFIKMHQGNALKNCEFTCGNISRKGEAVITEFGIEGSGIYPLSGEIRKQLIRPNISHPELVSGSHEMLKQFQHGGVAKLYIDFKPDLSVDEIKKRIENKGNLSTKDVLEKKINLTSTQVELLKLASSKEEYNDTHFLSQLLKKYPLHIVDFAPIDDAISTVGGLSLEEVNENLEIKKLCNTYVIGEMLDWDAPTGGYLLQACFSMGKFLADKLNVK